MHDTETRVGIGDTAGMSLPHIVHEAGSHHARLISCLDQANSL